MSNPEITRVAIGMTDGYRYVGVEPPLTTQELISLRNADILENDFTFEQIEDKHPVSTLIMVSGDFESIHPESRTEKAQKVAGEIARVLKGLREVEVYLDIEFVDLWGHHSTPFYPNTDRQV